ncbi:hypothetical protein COO60DRAFT_1459560 [Scenedesmus sp. NREL 46B-D3]|nr:hypothetical protein COO60DRAFT_1459560 [Scenedesmus sp. NREL 46B-D3]
MASHKYRTGGLQSARQLTRMHCTPELLHLLVIGCLHGCNAAAAGKSCSASTVTQLELGLEHNLGPLKSLAATDSTNTAVVHRAVTAVACHPHPHFTAYSLRNLRWAWSS